MVQGQDQDVGWASGSSFPVAGLAGGGCTCKGAEAVSRMGAQVLYHSAVGSLGLECTQLTSVDGCHTGDFATAIPATLLGPRAVGIGLALVGADTQHGDAWVDRWAGARLL